MTDFSELIKPFGDAFSGSLSLAYYHFASGSSFLHGATETMRSASLIKLPLLIQTLDRVARGELSLANRYKMTAQDQVGGAGILHTLGEGLEPSLQDLLTLMIIVSDNTATNMVIDLHGIASVNAFMQSLSLSQTRLIGKLQLPPERQNEAQKSGLTNATCAADILGLLIRLEQGDLLPPELTALAIGILKRQQFTEALARYLPTDQELYERSVTIASKSGCLRGLWHDAAIVYEGEHPLYALVIMTDGSNDKSYSFEQEGMMLIAKLARKIYSYHSP
ncbi:MAG: serine hydrolase [Trueperaceae bacterium]|nr:serine hydrolase [Trueperaceae bacterium]